MDEHVSHKAHEPHHSSQGRGGADKSTLYAGFAILAILLLGMGAFAFSEFSSIRGQLTKTSDLESRVKALERAASNPILQPSIPPATASAGVEDVTVYFDSSCAICADVLTHVAAVNAQSVPNGLRFNAVDVSGKLEAVKQAGFQNMPAVFFTQANSNNPDIANLLTQLQSQGLANPVQGGFEVPYVLIFQNSDHVLLSEGCAVPGKATLYEYSDFQCPFCQQLKPEIETLRKEMGAKLDFTFKHFPLNEIHPQANEAALASECARDQGKFQAYHDLLYDNQGNLTTPALVKYASSAGMDVKKFQACLSTAATTKQPLVDKDYQEGLIKYLVSGTPTLVLDCKYVFGGAKADELKKTICGLRPDAC